MLKVIIITWNNVKSFQNNVFDEENNLKLKIKFLKWVVQLSV